MKALGALTLTGSLLLGLVISAPMVSADNRVVEGTASTYGPGYDGLLALPEGRGIKVRVCSKSTGRCVVKVSNDAGPSKKMQAKGRVVDLDVPTFEYLCKCGWRTGLIKVSVEYLGRGDNGGGKPLPTAPATDTEEVQGCSAPVDLSLIWSTRIDHSFSSATTLSAQSARTTATPGLRIR